MSGSMTEREVRNEATRLEQVAEKDVSALAAQLHAMNPEDRLAVANQIKRDQEEHLPDTLPELDFYNDGDLKSAKKQISDEKMEQTIYDDDTGRMVRYVMEPGTVYNPYIYVQRAVELFEPKDPEKQDARSAEREWKKAIEAADRLPLTLYRAKLTEVQQKLAVETDPVKSSELLRLTEALREVIDLPFVMRMETAMFYVHNVKPDAAKEMLKQALVKNPTLKDNERFKQLVQSSNDLATSIEVFSRNLLGNSSDSSDSEQCRSGS